MGVLRIVGGSLKGRRIRVPDVPGVRPTSERVREAVFNILGQTLDGERVLDAFAGTGALGFEALSRGAALAVFAESSREVAASLSMTAERLGVSGHVRVVVGDVVRRGAAGALGGPFDLVLADPPYTARSGAELLAALARSALLAPEARIVVERSSAAGPPEVPDGLQLARTARYGATAVDFFVVSPLPAKEPA